MTVTLFHGDCVEVMRGLPDASIDAVITDPPYPEIDREYGRMSEAAWWDMMMGVCTETRRLLKPTGSAVFILQPNSHKVGSMRGWLWEFMAWVCRDWNMVQDVWWINTIPVPVAHCSETNGLMRPSAKAMVWAGSLECYRNQDAILMDAARNYATASNLDNRVRREWPSGNSMNTSAVAKSSLRRAGVTPFNAVFHSTGNSNEKAGAHGHGAGTPLELAKWWTRYIVPSGGTVLDPFVGSGTMMLAAMAYDCHGIGIDKMAKYINTAEQRTKADSDQLKFDISM